MSNPTDHAVILAAFDALLPQLPITADGLDREQMTLGALEIAARRLRDLERGVPIRLPLSGLDLPLAARGAIPSPWPKPTKPKT